MGNDVKAPVSDLASMQAEIARLRAENAGLKTLTQAKISFKVSDKGAVSAYGLGRFPVTLYAQQWERLMSSSEACLEFIKANRGSLATEADKIARKAAEKAAKAAESK